ncbi:hypothetical protein KVR01_011976 [Diaporthe batatas]|uniref:uncharacterized protein n=1 Tax=Diaporthe batatas TaxID=748121 RepID=UPI001D0544E1|nr:uncharacterized protein KVR01_011976 [Diaporthe batatas]KAG8158215.1 hypothetical protein KVR01_011976 [Diaporthe batatas]
MSDDDQGPLICGSIAAALFSATAFVAARLYCSVVVMRRTRREDIIIVLSLVFLWSAAAVSIVTVFNGMGKHFDTLTVEQRARAKLYYQVSVWPALLAITVPKAAVAGLIIRIFTPDIWTKTIMTSVVCIGIANYVVVSALSTFMCIPLASAWDERVAPVRCVSAKIYLDLCYFTSTYSASVDFYLAIYPALVFRKMGFNIIKKIGLSVVLGLGLVVTVVACLKISHLHVLSNPDFTWTSPKLTIWTMTEASVTIIAACIPVLHPLYDRARAGLRRIFPSLQQRRHGSGEERSTVTGRGSRGGVRRAHPDSPDSPGFWSLKLRALAAAESWWSSTGARTISRGQRSGVRVVAGQTEADAEEGEAEDEDNNHQRSARRLSGPGEAVVVIHDEDDEQRQGGGSEDPTQLTVGADQASETELSDPERALDRVGRHDLEAGSGQDATASGQM